MSTDLQCAMRKYRRAANVTFNRRCTLENLLTPILKDVYQLRINNNDYVTELSVHDDGVNVYYTSHACGSSSEEELFIPNRILFADDPRAERNKMLDELKQMEENERIMKKRNQLDREQEMFWNNIAGIK